MTASIQPIIQARMSSRRFPGKVLAPFKGRPIIAHVLDGVGQALPEAQSVVATSVERSDDPLAAYLESIGAIVHRGPLNRVFDRYCECSRRFPSDWVLRINADSPLLDPGILKAVALRAAEGVDLVTTTFPRSFPRGRNAELIRTRSMLRIDPGELTSDDQEHVTAYFYRNAGRFRILNVGSGRPELAERSLAVDAVEDLRRLEAMPEAVLAEYDAAAVAAGGTL